MWPVVMRTVHLWCAGLFVCENKKSAQWLSRGEVKAGLMLSDGALFVGTHGF